MSILPEDGPYDCGRLAVTRNPTSLPPYHLGTANLHTRRLFPINLLKMVKESQISDLQSTMSEIFMLNLSSGLTSRVAKIMLQSIRFKRPSFNVATTSPMENAM